MTLGLMIECCVAILLMITIGYCYVLNERLKHLRSDESTLKATIGELLGATQAAERAVASLKITSMEAERALAVRLDSAEKAAIELDRLVDVAGRVSPRAGAGTGTGQSPVVSSAARPALSPQAIRSAFSANRPV